MTSHKCNRDKKQMVETRSAIKNKYSSRETGFDMSLQRLSYILPKNNF